MHTITIYTDGACSHNPGGDGAFAAILIHPKKTLCISGYIPAPTTNDRAEWAAIIEAVAKLTAPCEVVVRSDSMNCVNAINGRGKKDAKRGNKDLVLRFREVAKVHQVSAVFVARSCRRPTQRGLRRCRYDRDAGEDRELSRVLHEAQGTRGGHVLVRCGVVRPRRLRLDRRSRLLRLGRRGGRDGEVPSAER